MVDVPPTTPVNELVAAAFHMARAKGKPDWRRMTLAVLKNRILQIKRGQFREQDYGAPSFRDLLMGCPVLRLDGAYAEFLGEEPPEQVPAAPVRLERTRIRPDLWRAILDFSSGRRYAWDSRQQVAREATADDEQIFPTVTREEFAQWRNEFATRHSGDEAVARWRDESLGTKDLPRHLQGEWNGTIKAKATLRLSEWFTAHGMDLSSTVGPLPQSRDGQVEDLRGTVIACVSVMTGTELAELKLPPAAVLRAKNAGRLRDA